MRKIRYYLTLVTLLVSLSGFTFLGLGAGSLTTVASSQHVTAQSVAFIPMGPCPTGGTIDC
ncbi:MAG TPA: hypothetical protein VKV40_12905 [Ktedonobacteraceae bacterium]|nr:hypothetical protein [Ktedonobacteraceae bacterium]